MCYISGMRNHALSATCERCGNTYAPRSNFARRCDNCVTFMCAHCGQSFQSRRKRAIRFCSLACTNDWQATAAAKDSARHRTIAVRGSGAVLRCATCDGAFYAAGWKIRRATPKYCGHACRDYHADMRGINRVLRFPHRKGANGLERAGAAILDSLGIEYVEQQVIGGKFVVDAFLPRHGIVVQWDGDFWHANPAHFATLHPIQEANQKRDRSCNAYLAACGYRVLRFWESDVHESPATVAAAIAAALA
jgi:very-short-patch-repair endonuclease